MARQYRYTLLRRIGNALVEPAIRLGIAPGKLHLLTVVGRKSGASYTTPVNLVERNGVEYLVAPYGEVSWVKNARAAGEVTLRRGRTSRARRIEELQPADAVEALKDYWHANAITHPYFAALPNDESGFLADAGRHPVFRLI